MIKNQTTKPNNIKCNISGLLNFNKYHSAKTTLKRGNKLSSPNWGSVATTEALGGGEYQNDWFFDDSKSSEPVIDEWSSPDFVDTQTTDINGSTASSTETFGFGWDGEPISIDTSPDWGITTEAAQYAETDNRSTEAMGKRSKRLLGGLGSLGRRGLGIITGNKTEEIRSAARGVAETLQGSSFGETASEWYSGAQESVNNYVNNPENREAATAYARSLGATCLEGAGVIKKTKHWEGVAGSGYRPSATGITRAAINPFGAARRGLMAGGDQVVRDLMQAKGGLTGKGVQYVQNYAAQQNPFMRFGINQALKRAKKQGWI